MGFRKYIASGIGVSFLVLVVYGLLQWMNVSTGHFIDWIIGIASFWWLSIIVTLPWNMHFKAKEILKEASISRKKSIKINEDEIEYAKKLSKRSLLAAIILHLLSAIGLYALAVFKISSIGYISSGAALLLTGLRPAIRAHEYAMQRLFSIRRKLFHPREDVIELRGRVRSIEDRVKSIEKQLDVKNNGSLAANHHRDMEAFRNDLIKVRVSVNDLRVNNESEHEHLTREAQNAIAQLSEDGRFLGNVREIIRFVKSA